MTDEAELARLSVELKCVRELMDERDQRYDERWQAQQEAIKAANAAMDRRMEGMNEFRAQLTEQTATFIPRQEYSARHDAINADISNLRDRMNSETGGQTATQRFSSTLRSDIAIAISALAVIATIATVVILH